MYLTQGGSPSGIFCPPPRRCYGPQREWLSYFLGDAQLPPKDAQCPLEAGPMCDAASHLPPTRVGLGALAAWKAPHTSCPCGQALVFPLTSLSFPPDDPRPPQVGPRFGQFCQADEPTSSKLPLNALETLCLSGYTYSLGFNHRFGSRFLPVSQELWRVKTINFPLHCVLSADAGLA